MSGNKIYAQMGVGFSGLLALLWCTLLSFPVNWLRFENLVLGFEVSLWHVYVRKGLATHAITGISSWMTGGNDSFTRTIDSIMDSTISITEAKMKFCAISIHGIADFCYMWEKAWYASWCMTILGYFGVMFFLIGSMGMYYYAFNHATETGRMWVRIMFALAPFCELAGCIAYMALTIDFGSGLPTWISAGAHAYWGPGFIVALAMIPLSFIPIYILAIFGKRDSFEKRRGDGGDYSDDDDEAVAIQGQGQGQAAYGSGGYGQQQQTAYGGGGGWGGGWWATPAPAPQQYVATTFVTSGAQPQPAGHAQAQWTSGPAVPQSTGGQAAAGAHGAAW